MSHPRYYGQRAIDKFLLVHLDGEKPGTFVDVGAHNGRRASNTLLLEQNGWRGVCIEPNPQSFAELMHERPLAKCVCAAAGDKVGLETFHVHRKGLNSTLDLEGSIDFRIKDGRKSGVDREEYTPIIAPMFPLEDILDNVGFDPPIGVLSIDTEGAEMRVLEGLDLNHWKPRIILIEAHSYADVRGLMKYFDRYNYKFARLVSPNAIICRTEEDARMLADGNQLPDLNELDDDKEIINSKYRNYWLKHNNRGYQKTIANKDMLHQNSKELVEILRGVPVTAGMKIFEIGCGCGRNLEYIRKAFQGVHLAGNDLIREQCFKHMEPGLRDVIDFHEGDTARMVDKPMEMDLLISSDHMMHLDPVAARYVMRGIMENWKPKWILIRESTKPRKKPTPVVHAHDYSALHEAYDVRVDTHPKVSGDFVLRLLERKNEAHDSAGGDAEVGAPRSVELDTGPLLQPRPRQQLPEEC